ncbi:MAG TPA: tRNA epoxyqueuosine(34) reductase QueG, partial [Deinococcales bacterium]|nr:tRNA epoxyqueuosine(34) reductase QueG [Deinococcales bacterium]
GMRVGRVARYAWSRDYHEVLRPHLEALEAAASTMGVRARAYVDHGPILERSFAIRAGLGWRGKSSQVLSATLGAYTTLAVVVTDLRPPDVEPGHPDRCGTCTRCVTACPTGAIGPDRTVDAGACLSYYTIEHRGSIPDPYRAGLGGHLFGCDDCLAVCPWSVRAGPVASLLEPDPELAHPDVEPFFTLSGHAFLRRYEGTAFARPRRRGMARNAALVIGNLGREDGLPLLTLGIEDSGAEVREASAWALGRLASAGNAGPALDRALGGDEALRSAARAGLAVDSSATLLSHS